MKRAFVILTKNVWQSAGIYNSATGKVVGLIISEVRPSPGLPDCVVVDFGESYTGPHFLKMKRMSEEDVC